MLKAVLFDMDGTLVPLDQELFVQSYLETLAGRVAHLVKPKTFIEQLLAATSVMIDDCDPGRTNEEVFRKTFFAGIGLPESKLKPVFDDFYENHFGRIGMVARPNSAARRAVEAVISARRAAVLATNPVFPLTAVKQRMGWGNIADLPFRHITSYETSHFCKPHTEYYLEVAEAIGVRPEECLMIGNDVEEDLAAAKVGMKVFLVTDCMINAKKLPLDADYIGTLEEMADFVGKKLSSL